MEHLYKKAQESADYIKVHTTKRPKIAVVLGSGLGNLTADFTETEELPYKEIPNFPVSTVAGHKGALLAVSCITNMAAGIHTVKHSHARVLEIANQSGETLCRWLGAVIQKMEG